MSEETTAVVERPKRKTNKGRRFKTVYYTGEKPPPKPGVRYVRHEGSPMVNGTQTATEASEAVEIATEPLETIEAPLGHYDRQRAGAQVYQVVAHTRDAIKVLGPKGACAAMIYRRSAVPGKSGEVVDNAFAEVAARELADFLNGQVEALR